VSEEKRKKRFYLTERKITGWERAGRGLMGSRNIVIAKTGAGKLLEETGYFPTA